MPAERLPMRKVREVLRQTAVGEYIRRAAVIGTSPGRPCRPDCASRSLFRFSSRNRRAPDR